MAQLMSATTPHILTINGGSSSIKFALFETGDVPRRILSGGIDRIGQARATLETQGPAAADHASQVVDAPNHQAAVDVLMEWIQQHLGVGVIAAVGHRIVQGGPNRSEPQLITDTLINEVRRLFSFDPEHLPEEILLIESVRRHFPDLPQVACFDTAFHHDLPRVAQLLAIPRRYERQGVRRYGFHGLSYEFLMGELAIHAGSEVAQGRIVLAHLGNGASVAAVHHGQSVDTSMGFTPSSGVPMGSRSGDIDPGLVGYLSQTEKMTAKQFNAMATNESGLLGVSETSSDMRDLLACEKADVRAAEAVALFCYQVKKCIGAFAAVLGGLDTLVFAGGIGESAPVIRQRICDDLRFLGIAIDPKRNAQNAPLISTDAARAQVRVIHTDEEIVIAKSTARVLHLQRGNRKP
jgi:acetate kinase